jgi:hypothetical protein
MAVSVVVFRSPPNTIRVKDTVNRAGVVSGAMRAGMARPFQ